MSKPTPIVTKDSLQQMINAAAGTDKLQHIIGRALVALFERQTQAEQCSDATHNDNGIGFASSDARSGSLSAKSYLKNKSLQQWQIDKWIKVGTGGYSRICKYARQLNEIAEAKRAKQHSSELEQLRMQYAEVVDSDDPKIIGPVVEQLRLLETRLGVKPYIITGSVK